MAGRGNDSDWTDAAVSDSERNNAHFMLSTRNKFECLEENGGQWQTQLSRRKRKKISSGGTSEVDSGAFKTLGNDDKLLCLFEMLNKNQTTLRNIESDNRKQRSDIQAITDQLTNNQRRIDSTDKLLQSHAQKLDVLLYKSINMEARGRRNNLIFWGLTERLKYDCSELLLSFLEDELEIDTTGMCIDRAHRLGRRVNGYDPRRPMIVRFRDYTDTERILQQAYKLRGTRFGVDRDYPKEIAEARRALYACTEAREARARRSKVQIRYPARLFIDGQLVDDKFPDWFQILSTPRIGIQSATHFEQSRGPAIGSKTFGRDRNIYSRETASDDEGSSCDEDDVFRRKSASPLPSTSVKNDKNKGVTSKARNTGSGSNQPRKTTPGKQEAVKKPSGKNRVVRARPTSAAGQCHSSGSARAESDHSNLQRMTTPCDDKQPRVITDSVHL